MKFVLDMRAASKSGAVVPPRLTQGDPQALQAASRVVFLLHGFNVDRPSGRDSLLRFAGLVPELQTAAAVAVLWPGDSYAGPLGYSFEKKDAEDSAAALTAFIADTLFSRPRISFVAHSLGSRVAMHTARVLVNRGYVVDQVCLMAAAIDGDSLAAPAVYRPAAERIGRIAVLHSRSDKVLRLAYPAGDWLQSFLFSDELSGSALGYRGPKAHKGTAAPACVQACEIPKSRKADHSDYLPGSNPNPQQLSAAAYANAVLQGSVNPSYV